MLDKLDDLMPKHCQFGSITREEAVRWVWLRGEFFFSSCNLRKVLHYCVCVYFRRLTMDSRGNPKYTRPGTYLIRDSSHPDVLHVRV